MLSPNKKNLKLLTDDEEEPVERDKDEILEEKNDRQTEIILGQLQFLENKKFVRAKTKLEIIEKSFESSLLKVHSSKKLDLTTLLMVLCSSLK